MASCPFSDDRDAARRHVSFLDENVGCFREEDINARAKADQAHPGSLRDDRADLVIGARSFDRAGMPRSRYFSNTVGSKVASWLVGCEIRDSQSGFRLIRLERLRGVRLRSRCYEFEMELLIKLVRGGGTVGHAPVRAVYHDGQARSKMHPVRDTVRICLWSLAFRYLRA